LEIRNWIEKGLMVIISTLIGGGAAYIGMVGKHDKAIGIIEITAKTQNEKIQEMEQRANTKISALEERTSELQKSRESLSDTYVTRREFNRIVEEQKNTLDKIDSKLEKLVEKIYEQP